MTEQDLSSRHEGQESLLGACRVLDLTDQKGLLCGRILGDFGADVIKIERPGGDAARNTGPFYKDEVHPEKSLYWFWTNLNKRSITLDIGTADGQEIFRRLVRTADFVIESFDPGYMEDLGLGYGDLEEINPRIIMTSITPYGRTGPHRDFKHSDLCTWAMGGMMKLCGDLDRAPVRTYPQTDFLGGLHGALGSMVAHYYRETTGEGQHVDVSIQQAVMLTLMVTAEYWDVLKINIPRFGSAIPFPRGKLPPLLMPQILPCKDGFVTFSFYPGDSSVARTSNEAVAEMMDRDGVGGNLKDLDWASFSAATVTQEEYDEVRKPIDRWLLTKTKAELYEEAIKRSILLAPVSNAQDLANNPQLRARGFWVDVEHLELDDRITYPGAAVRLSDCAARVRHRSPSVGEHNEEIYVRELGFTTEEMVLLRARGVV